MKGILRINIRTNLIKQYGIKSKGKDGYKYELLKAIWMYKQRDKMFEESLAEVNTINRTLTNLMLMQPINELERDPLKMNKEEFKKYYEELRAKFYSKPGLIMNLAEEFTEEEKKGESVGEESYASIDRKLKGERKFKAKKEKEECEKAAKEYLEELYKSIDKETEQDNTNE
jgi:hypothetical protein